MQKKSPPVLAGEETGGPGDCASLLTTQSDPSCPLCLALKGAISVIMSKKKPSLILHFQTASQKGLLADNEMLYFIYTSLSAV